MRILFLVAVLAATGVGLAQRPMVKTGPGGSSTIEVLCEDAFRTVDAAKRAALTQQFRSSIIVRCTARAPRGSGRVQPSDFSYQHRYAMDTRVHTLRLTDFTSGHGEVYGSIEREFFIGRPDRERPWVVVLYFGDGSTEIVFTRTR